MVFHLFILLSDRLTERGLLLPPFAFEGRRRGITYDFVCFIGFLR